MYERLLDGEERVDAYLVLCMYLFITNVNVNRTILKFGESRNELNRDETRDEMRKERERDENEASPRKTNGTHLKASVLISE